jgi:hypothetical protein
MTGQTLFIREKMKELRNNGESYATNRLVAEESWSLLDDQTKNGYNNAVPKKSPGQLFYVREKMKELRNNGQSRQTNRMTALDAWFSLDEETQNEYEKQVPVRPKKSPGRSFFVREKMRELRENGETYTQNKNRANESWENLSEETQNLWNHLAIGRARFVREEMRQLKGNGLSYPENKDKASKMWVKLSLDEQKQWGDQSNESNE